MTYPQTLPRAWVTIGVPDSPHSETGTYTSYPAGHLPEIPLAVRAGDGLAWLRELSEVGSGMKPDQDAYVTTPLEQTGVQELLAVTQVVYDQLPADLRALISEPGLQRRLFSATDAYFDAGQHLEPVPGGHLLHLISDSQWVCHWLAFIGDDGQAGVVCSDVGLGYEPDEDDLAARSDNPTEIVWVADSVAEFIWRWWADNYIFANAHPDLCPAMEAPRWFDPVGYTAGYGTRGA